MTIDPDLHEWAVRHSKTELTTDFSGYVAQLIVADKKRTKRVAEIENIAGGEPSLKGRSTRSR